MNGDFKNEYLLNSMKINSLNKENNNLNPLQFVSTPNFEDFKKINNNNNNIDISQNINNDKNNGLNNNFLNLSENELLNFELDQSTESIITNQSISHQLPIDYLTNQKNLNNLNNIQKYNTGAFNAQNICDSTENGEDNQNNNIDNEIIKYKNVIKNLEEKLKKEYLLNKQQNNYIEILKQTINNCLLKNENMKINNLNEVTKQLNKNKIDILTEYTNYKLENEKIKKQLVMQQILYNDMKNEISNLKQENNILKNSSEKISKENKALKKIKEEIAQNYEI